MKKDKNFYALILADHTHGIIAKTSRHVSPHKSCRKCSTFKKID